MVAGWIHARRDMGKVKFFDIRDKDGLLQVVVAPGDIEPDFESVADELRPEWVVQFEGIVQKRGPRQVNDKLITGTVELLAKKIVILNTAKTPPFEIDKDTSGINEEVRLKYRYLDLRSERMAYNIRHRHAVFQEMRKFLNDLDFVEIETPALTKGTPEGAREFLVPARLHPGKFYVLPQAPQQFKQLLMTAGFEKYYQMAKCYRDEDQRGDRQPEFTQMDMEMSFVEEDDVMDVIEKMMVAVVEKLYPQKKIAAKPFPRISYKEAMDKYGIDRPDLRSDKNNPDELAFCWVVDFPMFEKDDNGAWTFTHNPFSAPKQEFYDDLMAGRNIGDIVAAQYDLVLNGFEIGGGSIRNHKPEALRAVLQILGMNDEQIDSQFGHMLEAFSYGAPPHGGIALGLDRFVALLLGLDSIREVIAFPKTQKGTCLMTEAPSPVHEDQLKELALRLRLE